MLDYYYEASSSAPHLRGYSYTVCQNPEDYAPHTRGVTQKRKAASMPRTSGGLMKGRRVGVGPHFFICAIACIALTVERI